MVAATGFMLGFSPVMVNYPIFISAWRWRQQNI
jgi:hypothetical protein